MVPVLQSNGSLAHTSQAPVNRLSTLLDRIFNDDIFTPQALYALPLSMWEDEDKFYVEVDAPGMTEKFAIKKFCNACRKHTDHKEGKISKG